MAAHFSSNPLLAAMEVAKYTMDEVGEGVEVVGGLTKGAVHEAVDGEVKMRAEIRFSICKVMGSVEWKLVSSSRYFNYNSSYMLLSAHR
jgi:hypothetical protein